MLQQPQHELSHLINPLRGHLRQHPCDERINVVVAQPLHHFFKRQTPVAATAGSTGMTTAIERKPDHLRMEADGVAQEPAEIIASEMDGARFVG